MEKNPTTPNGRQNEQPSGDELQSSSPNTSYNRRTVLGAVGVATVAAGFSTPAMAKSEKNRESIGQRLFAEVAIHHRNVPDVWLAGTDPMAHYSIDIAEDNLYLLNPIGEKKYHKFKYNNRVIAVSGLNNYFPLGSTIPAMARNGPRVGPLRTLQAQNEYVRPQISTRSADSDAITVEVENESATVEPKSNASFELEVIEVEYLKETSEETEVNARGGGVKTVPRTVTETTTVTPVVKISNHGQLETYKPEEVKGR